MELTVPLVIGSVAALLLGLGAIFDDRRNRVRRWAEQEGDDFEAVLPLLHSINDDRCIGCEACIDVCPTEVLDLVDHKVRVSRFTDCVQCEQCANACPTQALVMYREGTTPRMLTVPELDENFQTAVPGQYLIGEVAGKPLVKNAANLGRAVIEHITCDLRRDLAGHASKSADIVDVLIVGSGPAGLSAGLTCVKNKLSFMVLEKEHVISSTVARYPKGKHFMAEPCTSQNVSYLPVFDATKEELVASWQRVVDGVKMPIRLGEAVDKITRGDDGIFETKTTVGRYKSRTVVLATGLRGKPRLLAVPGANLEKVQALLDDPAEFAGQHVLVVGGGDSAVEGAMSLADAGCVVTLSYRGDGFKRCKQGNQKRLAELSAQQKIAVLLESNVKEFTEAEVSIKLKDGSVSVIPNQRSFVLIGADTPVAWLETNSVRFVERPHLYALGSTEDVVRRVAPEATECPHDAEHAIATVLGQPLHKAPGRRALSVVEHLRDELHSVVTSVSGAFRLASLDEPRRPFKRAATDGSHAAPVVTAKGVQYGSKIVPASRLLGRAASNHDVLGGRTTANHAILSGRTTTNHAIPALAAPAAKPTPPLPRSARSTPPPPPRPAPPAALAVSPRATPHPEHLHRAQAQLPPPPPAPRLHAAERVLFEELCDDETEATAVHQVRFR
jgi:thioredoxin reductase (NADPH)